MVVEEPIGHSIIELAATSLHKLRVLFQNEPSF